MNDDQVPTRDAFAVIRRGVTQRHFLAVVGGAVGSYVVAPRLDPHAAYSTTGIYDWSSASATNTDS